MNQQGQPDALDRIADTLSQYGHRAQDNLSGMFKNMSPENWIRMTVIVGGYILLRPLALRFIGKSSVEKMVIQEKEEEERKAAEEAAKPEHLRQAALLLEQQEVGDADEDRSTTAWGQKARVRQRKVLKQMLEAEEKRLEDVDDKDIDEFLSQ